MKNLITLALFSFFCLSSQANHRFFTRIYLGANILGDQDISQQGLKSNGVNGEVQTSLGFRTGFSLGYKWNSHFSSELTWDYLTNSAKTRFSDGSSYPNGDYSARLHFLNTYYHFKSLSGLRPYVGFGAGIIQEIDIDLEDAAGEKSFSDEGGLGYQIILGAEYLINESWGIQLELANIGFSGPSFKQEGGTSTINDSEGYNPWNLNMALKYSF